MWSKKLNQPTSSNNETNRDWTTLDFPRLARAACFWASSDWFTALVAIVSYN